MRRVLLLTACWGLALPAGALAAGGPVPMVMGGAGATAPGARARYVTVRAGHDTRLERRSGGKVVATRTLPGRVGVPGAAYDGSTTGLSADGNTLVLTGAPRRDATRLVVIDTASMRARPDLVLPGYFAVDAISPDGRWLYFTKYKPDLVDYEVRAYDLTARRLLPDPIVDPREPDEKMVGAPVSRVMSPDGRWAYTLYTGAENFIHALDTAGRTAACIDLEDMAGNVASTRLRLSGGTLHVGGLATVDTRTLKVTRPGESPPTAPSQRATPSAPARADDGGALWWALLALPLAAIVALGVNARRRGRARAARV